MSSTANHSACLILTTLAADSDATTLARTLVTEGLAACVNVLPAMTSVYRWKGGIEEDREQQLIIKTTVERRAAVEARLRDLHPYDLPECLVIEASGGSTAYLEWIRESVS